MKRSRLMIVVVMALLANVAHAEQMVGNYHVKSLFAEPGAAGVYLQEGLPQCLYDLMYIDVTTAEGKARLALLTSAKMGGWPVTRLGYSRDATSSKCVLTSVHVG